MVSGKDIWKVLIGTTGDFLSRLLRGVSFGIPLFPFLMRYIDALVNRLLEKCSGIVAPSLLSVSCDSKVLTWQDNSDNETGFSIERSGDNYIFSEIDTVTAGEVTYTDATADPMTSYFYRIRGFNASGYSAYSNVVPCEGAVVAAVKYGHYITGMPLLMSGSIAAEGDFSVPNAAQILALRNYSTP